MPIKDEFRAHGHIDRELISAARRGDADHVMTLLEEGANPDAASSFQGSALHQAAAQGHVHVLALLLQKGADINKQTETGLSALMTSIWQGQRDAAAFLIEEGIHLDIVDGIDGSTALHHATRKNMTDIAQAMLAAGARMDIETQEGLTPVMLARQSDLVATDMRDVLEREENIRRLDFLRRGAEAVREATNGLHRPARVLPRMTIVKRSP